MSCPSHSHAELLELQLVLETGAQFFDDAAQSASAAHSERADDAGALRQSRPAVVCTPTHLPIECTHNAVVITVG